MFCSKCGNKLESDAQFCSMCGNKIENELPAENLEKTNAETVLPVKNNKTKIILVVVFALVIAIIVFFIFYIHNVNKEHSDESNNSTYQTTNSTNSAEFSIENSMLQSNLNSWAMVCMTSDAVYYSDMQSGIYIQNSGNKFASGIYSDLCCLEEKLVCVEYFYVQETENSSSEHAQLVMFDIKTKEKSIVYAAPTGEDYIMVSNVLENKVYFTLSENALFTCDVNGNVKDTGIRNVRKVTESGIYTAKYTESGLRLVSFDNEEIVSFENLINYNVIVNFELNGKLYVKLCDVENDAVTFAIVNIETGDFQKIKNQEKYGQMTNVNFKDNLLFCTFVDSIEDTSSCAVYSSNLDGSNMKLLDYVQKDNVNTTLNLISVFDDGLYISFPYSEVEAKFIKIK